MYKRLKKQKKKRVRNWTYWTRKRGIENDNRGFLETERLNDWFGFYIRRKKRKKKKRNKIMSHNQKERERESENLKDFLFAFWIGRRNLLWFWFFVHNTEPSSFSFSFCFMLVFCVCFNCFMFGICVRLLRKQTVFVTEWGGVSCETVAFLGGDWEWIWYCWGLGGVLWVWVGFIWNILFRFA